MLKWILEKIKKTGIDETVPAKTEKRKFYRMAKRISALLLLDELRALNCIIKDVSYSGIRFFLPQKMPAGKEITLRILSKDQMEAGSVPRKVEFPARVVWCRKKPQGIPFECGLSFVPMSDEKKENVIRFFFREYGIQFLEPVEKRRHFRLSTDFTVKYTFPNGHEDEGIARDLSATGIRLVSMESFPLDSAVTIFFQITPENAVYLRGQVRRSKEIARSGTYDIGIIFSDLSEEIKEKIIKGLLYLLENQIKESVI